MGATWTSLPPSVLRLEVTRSEEGAGVSTAVVCGVSSAALALARLEDLRPLLAASLTACLWETAAARLLPRVALVALVVEIAMVCLCWGITGSFVVVASA